MGNTDVCFEPVTPDNTTEYIRLGTTSYYQHYIHLWKNGDPTPYITQNFSTAAVSAELGDPNNALYLIYYGRHAAGTLKLSKNSLLPGHSPEASILLDKIYVLGEFAGRGIGRKALSFITSFARSLGKSVIALYSMQKGQALSFYLKNGFTIQGEKRLDYPEVRDEHRMMYLLTRNLPPLASPESL